MIRQDELALSVNQFLATRARLACLLLVHSDPATLRKAEQWLAQRYPWPLWPVGEELSAALLNMAARDRPAAAVRWFRDTAATRAPDPILVTDIALLFEPALQLDPLWLLRDAARRAAFVVAWPGTVSGNRLAYGVAQHAHYRTWPASDLGPTCIFAL